MLSILQEVLKRKVLQVSRLMPASNKIWLANENNQWIVMVTHDVIDTVAKRPCARDDQLELNWVECSTR